MGYVVRMEMRFTIKNAAGVESGGWKKPGEHVALVSFATSGR